MKIRRIARCIVYAALGFAVQPVVHAQTPADHGQPAQTKPMSMKGMSEAEFVPMMIKHHEDGIQMAQLEEQKGVSAEVKALAAKIREAQERDIPELKQHSHGSDAAAKGTAGHEGHDKMTEQHSQVTMERLNSASGAALDHAFVEEMVKHHQMAIEMAQTAKIQNTDLKKFAQKMVAGQRQELTELKKLQAAHGPAK